MSNYCFWEFNFWRTFFSSGQNTWKIDIRVRQGITARQYTTGSLPLWDSFANVLIFHTLWHREAIRSQNSAGINVRLSVLWVSYFCQRLKLRKFIHTPSRCVSVSESMNVFLLCTMPPISPPGTCLVKFKTKIWGRRKLAKKN